MRQVQTTLQLRANIEHGQYQRMKGVTDCTDECTKVQNYCMALEQLCTEAESDMHVRRSVQSRLTCSRCGLYGQSK